MQNIRCVKYQLKLIRNQNAVKLKIESSQKIRIQEIVNGLRKGKAHNSNVNTTVEVKKVLVLTASLRQLHHESKY